jgi:hypothetical protein
VRLDDYGTSRHVSRNFLAPQRKGAREQTSGNGKLEYLDQADAPTSELDVQR